jgi:hypothetical protein
MAHFAELNENNIVTRVIVVHNDELLIDGVESEQKGIDFCVAHYGGTWVQTSYNRNFRKNFAGVNAIYDPIRDAFIYQKPYDSWTLNEDTCHWEAPVPYPNTDKYFEWNETDLVWVEVA